MIKIDNVTKIYGKTVAVDGVSLHVRPGECFGFLGPNGAGKTTTLKMLAGLLVPTQGAMTVAGYDIQRQALEAKKMIGFVPDKPFIYEKLTGWEFLEFIRTIYGVDGDSGVLGMQNELISMFGLSDWLNELVESYSHGMRQKLVITSALIHNPKALIIDEPMVGLDARGMRQVKELFRELVKRGSTVLLSTHTMATAQEICDRIGILSKGRLVAVGTLDELREKAGGGDLESIFLWITERQAQDPNGALTAQF
ncbi:MAG: ABC transporter ATP-binding protein [Nitrospinae bacterium]|nr:ABC transporter ATP-binding protein [Nitrospinota bacterium]